MRGQGASGVSGRLTRLHCRGCPSRPAPVLPAAAGGSPPSSSSLCSLDVSQAVAAQLQRVGTEAEAVVADVVGRLELKGLCRREGGGPN